jgi:hypothetical protein
VNAVGKPSFDRHHSPRIVRWIAFAPFMLLRGVLRAGFRVGVFFLLDAQITLLGVLFTACGLVTVASVVYGIYQYSTDPVKQLHSKQIALAWARQIEREEDMDRQKRGLAPLSQDERKRRQAPLEREIAELEARIAPERARDAAQARGPAATP